jgi:hypothetical protein
MSIFQGLRVLFLRRRYVWAYEDAPFDAEDVRLLLEENARMRWALTEIAGCNDGKGYMPELARRALRGK